MAGGFVFVGKSRLRKIRKETRKLKKLEQKKRNSLGRSGEWSPQILKTKYEPLLSPRDDTDNISVCSSDSAISSGSEDSLPLIDLRPHSTVFTMPFGPFKKSKEQEEKKRREEEAERLRLEEEERLRKEEEERLRQEEEERLRQEEEERQRKEEEERLAEEKRLEEERLRLEAEARKAKIFGIFSFGRKKSPKDEEVGDKQDAEMGNIGKEKSNKEEAVNGKEINGNAEKGNDVFGFSILQMIRQIGKTPEEPDQDNKTNKETENNAKNKSDGKDAVDPETPEKKEESDIFSIFKRLGRRKSEEERRLKEEEEARLKEIEGQRQEEERARLEEERLKKEEDKGIFGISLFKNKFLKPKEEKSEQQPLTTPVAEAKEAEVRSDVASQTIVDEEKAKLAKKDDDTKSLDSGIESQKNGVEASDEQDGQKAQKVEKAKIAEEERECTEMLCCTIM